MTEIKRDKIRSETVEERDLQKYLNKVLDIQALVRERQGILDDVSEADIYVIAPISPITGKPIESENTSSDYSDSATAQYKLDHSDSKLANLILTEKLKKRAA